MYVSNHPGADILHLVFAGPAASSKEVSDLREENERLVGALVTKQLEAAELAEQQVSYHDIICPSGCCYLAGPCPVGRLQPTHGSQHAQCATWCWAPRHPGKGAGWAAALV
jgi:hypothetical protein